MSTVRSLSTRPKHSHVLDGPTAAITSQVPCSCSLFWQDVISTGDRHDTEIPFKLTHPTLFALIAGHTPGLAASRNLGGSTARVVYVQCMTAHKLNSYLDHLRRVNGVRGGTCRPSHTPPCLVGCRTHINWNSLIINYRNILRVAKLSNVF